jgi:hypothetical protein
MKNFKSTIAALIIGIVGFGAISISADELKEQHVMVEFHKLSDNNSKVDINVNGEAQVFELPDLQIGETKDITTQSGKTILITKTESGMTVNIDGKELNLPAVGNDMSAHIMRGGLPLRQNNGIQVIGDLTDEQVTIINDAFLAAGVEKNVHFTQGHEMKFFLSGDSDASDLAHVKKWISKDGDNVKIIKMGGSNTVIDIDNDDLTEWLSNDGTREYIKIKGQSGEIHVKNELIIIKKEEESH